MLIAASLIPELLLKGANKQIKPDRGKECAHQQIKQIYASFKPL